MNATANITAALNPADAQDALTASRNTPTMIMIGIVISFTGAFLYALGIVIQRAAFTSQHKRCIPHRQAWWTFGLCVYGFGGLVLGSVALSFVSLAISTSLFSSSLVFNALIAKVWLKEPVKWYDIKCYVLIVAGISLNASQMPAAGNVYTLEQTADLYFKPAAIVFWIVIGGGMIVLHYMVYKINLAYPGDSLMTAPNREYRTAMIASPVVLGMLAGLAYVGMKGFTNMIDHWYNSGHKTQHESVFFYGFWVYGILIMADILFWIKWSYKRFPTTAIFPLELGALSITSINGGLFVYNEFKHVEAYQAVLMYAGMAGMAVGMGLLALSKDTRQPCGEEGCTKIATFGEHGGHHPVDSKWCAECAAKLHPDAVQLNGAAELEASGDHSALPPHFTHNFMDEADKDQDGTVDKEEFAKWHEEKTGHKPGPEEWGLFDRMDVNNDGNISLEEFQAYLNKGSPKKAPAPGASMVIIDLRVDVGDAAVAASQP